MTSPQCVITGCVLHDPSLNRALVADLFDAGNHWLVLGNVWPNGTTQWQEDDSIPTHWKTIEVNEGAYFFERRGIIVVKKSSTSLNEAAQAYIGGKS